MNSPFQIFSASFRATCREVLPTTTALTELLGAGGEITWLKGVPGINSPSAQVLLPASGPLAVVCVILRGVCCGWICIMLANDAAGRMTPIPVEEEAAWEDFASNYPGGFTIEITFLLALQSCKQLQLDPTLVLLVSYSMHLITPFNYPPATNQLP